MLWCVLQFLVLCCRVLHCVTMFLCVRVCAFVCEFCIRKTCDADGNIAFDVGDCVSVYVCVCVCGGEG